MIFLCASGCSLLASKCRFVLVYWKDLNSRSKQGPLLSRPCARCFFARAGAWQWGGGIPIKLQGASTHDRKHVPPDRGQGLGVFTGKKKKEALLAVSKDTKKNAKKRTPGNALTTGVGNPGLPSALGLGPLGRMPAKSPVREPGERYTYVAGNSLNPR